MNLIISHPKFGKQVIKQDCPPKENNNAKLQTAKFTFEYENGETRAVDKIISKESLQKIIDESKTNHIDQKSCNHLWVTKNSNGDEECSWCGLRKDDMDEDN